MQALWPSWGQFRLCDRHRAAASRPRWRSLLPSSRSRCSWRWSPLRRVRQRAVGAEPARQRSTSASVISSRRPTFSRPVRLNLYRAVAALGV